MSHYNHLTIDEREMLWEMRINGNSLREIARKLGRNPSTISRELARNSGKDGYRPSVAHAHYQKRRKKCHRRKILITDPAIASAVRRLIAEQQWSPEEIACRMKLEGTATISYPTIYRALKCGILEGKGKKKIKGRYALEKNLRRKRKPHGGNRGKSLFSKAAKIHDRPAAANDRSEYGHLEGDTVYCSIAKVYILTLVDRKSRYLWTACCKSLTRKDMTATMLEVLKSLPEGYLKSITLDRGTEFQCYREVSEALGGIPIFFADPMSPWQRGTNENTNGLLRQYIPKYTYKVPFSPELLRVFTSKLNLRPRKCLNWLSPAELFFFCSLHLT